ncbi:hypothetical protein CRG98_031539, partial [Punica granatum]
MATSVVDWCWGLGDVLQSPPIGVVPKADEGVARVEEEAAEDPGDRAGAAELDDEAGLTDADLE